MSVNPLSAASLVKERLAGLAADIGPAVRAAASPAFALGRVVVGANLGAVLPASEAHRLVARFGLRDVRELMLLLLDVEKGFPRPGLSSFAVGAVGLESSTGNLVLGGNVAFPQSRLGFTLHAEGFVFTRAFSRGTSISVLAIAEAQPCPHCRQYFSEFTGSRVMALIDPHGHSLTMAQLYPWPFDRDNSGERAAVPGARHWPDLQLHRQDLPAGTARRLLAAGARAYAPYSQCPGAVVIELSDGNVVTGASIESVAFSPTMQPIQAAIVDLIAHGYGYDDIAHVTLGTVLGGDADYADSTADVIDAISPRANFTVAGWSA